MTDALESRQEAHSDLSSAALSTNTSGPHRSHGQDRWPSSGPHRTVFQRSGSVVGSRVRRACSTRRFCGSLSLRVSRSSAKGSTSSGSPARVARSQRHRRRLNIRPVRPAPTTTAYGLVQAWDRQRMTSWRQPDGAGMDLLSPDGHTGHRRSPARSLSRTGAGASHRRRRGAARIDRAPGSRAGNPGGPAGDWPSDVNRGRLMSAAWSCGVPGQ